MITVTHLSFAFGSDWTLKNISCHVRKGEFLFLTGPSGAGKTTFLRLLHGALPLQRGQVQVAGFDLETITPRKLPRLRRVVSVVFQDFKVLSNRTVKDNVALPLQVMGIGKTQGQRRVGAVLRGLDMSQKAELLCKELSGGEQQRVAIARAIVVKPQLLLADEPTGNLDEDLSLRLLQIFQQFNKHGTTILFATHNKRLLKGVRHARIIRLMDGMLSEK